MRGGSGGGGCASLPLCLALALVLIFSTATFSDASRRGGGGGAYDEFEIGRDTRRPSSGHFADQYLPRKRFPVPVSGPSRKHNDIGLQSWTSSVP
ncbi:hypothetical protein DM860_013094 [Cuscuta australis]|uniref:Uncharacterized protein n=1 Tax=Cuscuta australis TaxID=267555 RepID=A0A328D7H8_9ASTE|nr:hypothetical protein DM860_013094 [Cuscuta australis]